MKRLAHVESHVRPRDRQFVVWLLKPMTIQEIANEIHYSRSASEKAWQDIKISLALPDGSGTQSIARLALLRLVLGLDDCVCQRFAADLDKAS